MGAAEISAIETFIHATLATEILRHAVERMEQKSVSENEINKTVQYGKIIEIHNDAKELRAVARLDMGRPRIGICAVLALQSKRVVTTWKNSTHDNHATLDLSAYNWNVDARKLIGALC